MFLFTSLNQKKIKFIFLLLRYIGHKEITAKYVVDICSFAYRFLPQKFYFWLDWKVNRRVHPNKSMSIGKKVVKKGRVRKFVNWCIYFILILLHHYQFLTKDYFNLSNHSKIIFSLPLPLGVYTELIYSFVLPLLTFLQLHDVAFPLLPFGGEFPQVVVVLPAFSENKMNFNCILLSIGLLRAFNGIWY